MGAYHTTHSASPPAVITSPTPRHTNRQEAPTTSQKMVLRSALEILMVKKMGGRRLVIYRTVLHAEQFGLEHSSSYEFSFFCIKSSLNAVKSASDFSKRLF